MGESDFWVLKLNDKQHGINKIHQECAENIKDYKFSGPTLIGKNITSWNFNYFSHSCFLYRFFALFIASFHAENYLLSRLLMKILLRKFYKNVLFAKHNCAIFPKTTAKPLIHFYCSQIPPSSPKNKRKKQRVIPKCSSF